MCAPEALEASHEVQVHLEVEKALPPKIQISETTGFPPGEDGKPRFEHIQETMSEEDRQRILKNVVLDEDPSSKHFAQRLKAIRFATIINGRVQTFTQNYFLQDAEYNDFSGGYRRYYGLINEELFEPDAPIAKVVLEFAKYYSIPEKTCILIQIQTSYFDQIPKNHRASVAGQGIHTDGADRAMLVCLHRGELIEGAENVFHDSLDGTEELCEGMPLQNREGVYFKDNSLYHHVTRAGVRGKPKNRDQVSRTMMIMHAPAEIYLQGLPNPNNTLGTNDSFVKLRDQPETVQKTVRKRDTWMSDHVN